VLAQNGGYAGSSQAAVLQVWDALHACDAVDFGAGWAPQTSYPFLPPGTLLPAAAAGAGCVRSSGPPFCGFHELLRSCWSTLCVI
jgi:hypothetical protein